MTECSFDKTFAAAGQRWQSGESHRPRREALQALSCDTEQLWQTLADRFGDRAEAGPPATTRLQHVAQALINLTRGQMDRAGRDGGVSGQGCGYVRHA